MMENLSCSETKSKRDSRRARSPAVRHARQNRIVLNRAKSRQIVLKWHCSTRNFPCFSGYHIRDSLPSPHSPHLHPVNPVEKIPLAFLIPDQTKIKPAQTKSNLIKPNPTEKDFRSSFCSSSRSSLRPPMRA
jgi:hypothetical protein